MKGNGRIYLIRRARRPAVISAKFYAEQIKELLQTAPQKTM